MMADLRNKRTLILAAAPMESLELRTIFSSDPNGIRRRLESPVELRGFGWGLAMQQQSKLVGGEFIRTESFREVVDLYRDGYLIVGAEVNREFLAWSDKDDLRIHPLALIELTNNFTRFYEFVLEDLQTRPKKTEFRIYVENMHLDGKKTRLPPGEVGSMRWQLSGGLGREAPSNRWSKTIIVASDAQNYKPEGVAFSLIRELYFWFGHSEEDIPYARDTNDGKAVDAERIKNIR